MVDAYVKNARRLTPAALGAALLLATTVGCDDRETEVRSYPAPKDAAPSTLPSAGAAAPVDARPVGSAPQVPAAAASGAADTGAAPGAGTGAGSAAAPAAASDAPSLPLQWTLPEGWKQDPQQRPMRIATVFVESNGKRGELIVTRFRAGGFGGVVANINRWRQQVGLPPINDESEAKPETLKVGGADAKAYDFTGPAAEGGNPPNRNRVVMVETAGGDVWFFRFFGPADLIEQQRGAFDALLQSVKFNNQG